MTVEDVDAQDGLCRSKDVTGREKRGDGEDIFHVGLEGGGGVNMIIGDETRMSRLALRSSSSNKLPTRTDTKEAGLLGGGAATGIQMVNRMEGATLLSNVKTTKSFLVLLTPSSRGRTT